MAVICKPLKLGMEGSQAQFHLVYIKRPLHEWFEGIVDCCGLLSRLALTYVDCVERVVFTAIEKSFNRGLARR